MSVFGNYTNTTMEITTSLASALTACQYSKKTQVRQEILQVLGKWPTLTPSKEPFVTNNGMRQTIVRLKGTIPITYKGNDYHTPICIWLMTDYPESLPIIYVLPTPWMRISRSKWVDRNGEVHIPVSLPIRFSLETLVRFLITIFEENPPLYVKKRNRGNDDDRITSF